jgi:hypothetical protein
MASPKMTTTSRQTAFRFTSDDLRVLAALQEKTGIRTQTDVVRLALRELAKAQGVDMSKKSGGRRRGAA